jgi:heptose I phosphotransferase
VIVVRDDMRALFPEQSVAEFSAIEGELFKRMPGRHTLRFERGGAHFFIKAHFGVGWGEIIKNLLMFKLPVISAQPEWEAVQRLEQLGIPTMRLVAYGREGSNPARIRSFVLTEALENTMTLEEWLPRLMQQPASARRWQLKQAVISEVARIAATLHDNGLNHRDFYACHFRLDTSTGEMPAVDKLRIHLMDLHRVQQRRHTPRRWRAKDLSALIYSVLYQLQDIAITRGDILRFMQTYSGDAWRRSLDEDADLWRLVRQRVVTMYRKDHGSEPDFPFV